MAYNEVMDALQNFRPSPRVDPMDRLPSEIWGNILLQMSVVKMAHLWNRISRIGDIIPFTMVSKRWRNCILSECRLWTIISLKPCNYDMAKMIAWQLKFSGNLPLTLVVQHPFDRWKEVHPVLIKHGQRIESIVLSGFPPHGYTQAPWLVRQIISDLAPLPNLQEMGHTIYPISQWKDLPDILNLCGSLNDSTKFPSPQKCFER
ncbi:hypothetical protein CPB86DRAFT_791119 [Serendipita vermifera]|nr:hypothetical protein CPB86DRAFT_791119 [Serendipita vermifera]